MKSKTRLVSFLMGAVAALILCSLSLPALAVGGAFTITGSPINVMVNGEVFQPKDVNGNDVLVFVCNGTTYAPLRALAEAYGLEVSYDGSRNMAVVNDPGKAAATTPAPVPSVSSFSGQWKVTGLSTIRAKCEKMAAEALELVPGYTVTMYFSYGNLPLGNANAMNGYTISNFDLAGAWIK